MKSDWLARVADTKVSTKGKNKRWQTDGLKIHTNKAVNHLSKETNHHRRAYYWKGKDIIKLTDERVAGQRMPQWPTCKTRAFLDESRGKGASRSQWQRSQPARHWRAHHRNQELGANHQGNQRTRRRHQTGVSILHPPTI